MNTCRHCLMSFQPKRKEQVYCSKSCAGHLKGINKRGKKLTPRIGWSYSKETRDKNGYVRLYAGNHPYANGRKMIAEHIMVMELKIGRALISHECVHHINEDKLDNRIENLALMTKSAHSSEHAKEVAARRIRTSGGRFA